MKKSFLIKVLGLTMALSLTMVGAAFATGAADVPGGALTSTLAADDGAGDNTSVINGFNVNDNANKTGVGVGGQEATPAVSKAKPAQRTHGEYQSNTNSCASCHQTHTAASANLLFKDGVYTTCTACHDGTLGTLNVFTGSSAGTFGGTAVGGASMHLPTGAMQMSAAPGGNHTPVVAGKEGTGWDAEFTCASCHSPHGSYSDRLLNYNPNGIAATNMFFQNATLQYTQSDLTTESTTGPIATGGLKVVMPVVDVLPAFDATSPAFVVLRTLSDTAGIGVTTEPAATPVIVVMKKGASAYARDLTPWINDAATAERAKLSYFTSDTGNVTQMKDKTNFIGMNLGNAYAYNRPASTVTLANANYADIARAVVVKLALESKAVPQFFNGIEVKQVNQSTYDAAGMGVPVSTFCSACHTDYMVKSGDADGNGDGNGIWSKAFRHTTTSDSYTCLKCHFAHGTDVNVMLDAKDKSLTDLTAVGGQYVGDVPAATAYLLDTNASSALKRYTGMSVCWKCHTSSHAGDMINNTFVQGGSTTLSTEFNKIGANLPNGWVGAKNPVEAPNK